MYEQEDSYCAVCGTDGALQIGGTSGSIDVSELDIEKICYTLDGPTHIHE